MARSEKTKAPKDFEESIFNADYDALVELAAQHNSKRTSFSFCEILKHMKKDELNKLMKQLLKILMEYIQKNLNNNTAVDWTMLSSEQCKSIAQFIQATTDIGLACIRCGLTSMCRVELIQIAAFLHEIMLPMPDSMDYVKNFISHYCEKLFSSGISENCELFLCNVILYLTRRTLASKPTKNDVKRLYAIRNALPIVMKQDGPNTAQLWSLFSACIISDIYLDMVEGHKIIILVMALDRDRLLELHDKIKSYILNSSLRQAAIYGKIYFEIWYNTIIDGNPEMKEIIEINCIQSYILMALQAEEYYTLLLARKVLHNFYYHKKDHEVSKILFSLFRPLIWKYIKNPSGSYRAWAAQLLLDLFPLEDPDGRIVTNDMEINDQLIMIHDLLIDDFPIVRITTLLGICNAISLNWELFPKEMLRTFFRIIVQDLSCDSNSEVRVAVVQGMRCLLKNPLTKTCLSNVLPKLIGLFHDVNERVRIAYSYLLLKVKRVSYIKYLDIVPLDHIFSRMEEDSRVVKKLLTGLLQNSYIPNDGNPKVWFARSSEMMKTERRASRIFFTYVSNFIGMKSSVKFMIEAAKFVRFHSKTRSYSSHVDLKFSDRQNLPNYNEYLNTVEESVEFGNLQLVNTVMQAISVMWLSLEADSNNQVENKNLLKMLSANLKKILPELCLYYRDTKAWESIFYLSSFLPPIQVPCLASLCFFKLKNLPPDAQESDYLTLLFCLANHNQMYELLCLLKEWIEAGLYINGSNVSVPPAAEKKRGRRNGSEGIYLEQPKPYLANCILETILKQSNLQKIALKEKSALQDILYLSDGVKKKLEKAQRMSEAKADFFNLFFYNAVKISVEMHNLPDKGLTTSVPFLNEFIRWSSEKLMKHITHVEDKTNHFTSLTIRIYENLCAVLIDGVIIGYFEPGLFLDFIYSLLCTDFGYKFLLRASRFLYKYAAISQYILVMKSETVMMENHLYFLSKVFCVINNEAMLEKLSETELKEITHLLASVMLIVNMNVNKLQLSSEIFRHILKNILNSSAAKYTDIVEEMAEDPFDRLSFSKTGRFFWLIISQMPKIIQTYIKTLTHMLKSSQDVDLSYWIACWVITWNFLHINSITQPDVREIHGLVLQLEKCIHNVYPCRKDSQQSNVQGSSEPVQLQLFQDHCHAELVKLKNRTKSTFHSKSSKKIMPCF